MTWQYALALANAAVVLVVCCAIASACWRGLRASLRCLCGGETQRLAARLTAEGRGLLRDEERRRRELFGTPWTPEGGGR